LARNPRRTVHFTLTSASWLNAVEASSQPSPNAASNAESSDPSPTSKPGSIQTLEWVADPDKIIAAVKRGIKCLDSTQEMQSARAASSALLSTSECRSNFTAYRTSEIHEQVIGYDVVYLIWNQIL